MVESEIWYPITWLGIRGDGYILDCQDREQAEHIAVGLAEQGRKLVQLHSAYQIEPDPKITARLRRRIEVAIQAAPLDAAAKRLA